MYDFKRITPTDEVWKAVEGTYLGIPRRQLG